MLLANLRSRLRSQRREAQRRAKSKRFYSQFIDKNALVFDVGANVGDRTATFASMGSRVVAFEPQPSCIDQLTQRFHGSKTVQIVPKALSSVHGSVSMTIFQDRALASCSEEWISTTAASGRFDTGPARGVVEVEAITLDEAIEEFGVPRFCKIDVEGYELDVLKGLSSRIEYMSLEFASEYLEHTKACLDLLKAHGWMVETAYSLGESMELSDAGWAQDEQLLASLRSLPHLAWGDIYVHLR